MHSFVHSDLVHCSWFILFEGIHLVACFLFQSLLRRGTPTFFLLSRPIYHVMICFGCYQLHTPSPLGINYPSPGRPASPMELARVPLYQQLSVSPWEGKQIVCQPEFEFFFLRHSFLLLYLGLYSGFLASDLPLFQSHQVKLFFLLWTFFIYFLYKSL